MQERSIASPLVSRADLCLRFPSAGSVYSKVAHRLAQARDRAIGDGTSCVVDRLPDRPALHAADIVPDRTADLSRGRQHVSPLSRVKLSVSLPTCSDDTFLTIFPPAETYPSSPLHRRTRPRRCTSRPSFAAGSRDTATSFGPPTTTQQSVLVYPPTCSDFFGR